MASWGSSGSQAPPGFSMTQDDDEEEFDPTKPKKKRAVKQSVTVEKKLVIKSAERTAAQFASFWCSHCWTNRAARSTFASRARTAGDGA